MKNRFIVALSLLTCLGVSNLHAEETAPAQYQSSCFACHSTGAAGAPKTGDKAAWESRFKIGVDGLIASVQQGKGAMPPGGLCADCTKDDIKALIEYMAGHKF